jgi:RimJ/RimL family protein N-acetyltransferase
MEQNMEKKDYLNMVLESERLFLKPMSLDYVEETFKEFTPEITKFMAPRSPEKIDETREYYTGSIKKIGEGEKLDFNFFVKDTGEYIGNGGLSDIKTKTPELGVWIKKSAHGHKYGREAMQRLKDWADENIDYDYIKYPVVDENIASRKIPESMGGVVEAESDEANGAGVMQHLVEYRIYKNKK